MLKMLGGHSIINNITNIPSLFTRSNALVRSKKAIYKVTFCSLHFSCSCRTLKSKSTLQLWPTVVGEEGSQPKRFVSNTKLGISPVVIAIRAGPLILKQDKS